jgi:hypothetical protein
VLEVVEKLEHACDTDTRPNHESCDLFTYDPTDRTIYFGWILPCRIRESWKKGDRGRRDNGYRETEAFVGLRQDACCWRPKSRGVSWLQVIGSLPQFPPSDFLLRYLQANQCPKQIPSQQQEVRWKIPKCRH